MVPWIRICPLCRGHWFYPWSRETPLPQSNETLAPESSSLRSRAWEPQLPKPACSRAPEPVPQPLRSRYCPGTTTTEPALWSLGAQLPKPACSRA